MTYEQRRRYEIMRKEIEEVRALNPVRADTQQSVQRSAVLTWLVAVCRRAMTARHGSRGQGSLQFRRRRLSQWRTTRPPHDMLRRGSNQTLRITHEHGRMYVFFVAASVRAGYKNAEGSKVSRSRVRASSTAAAIAAWSMSVWPAMRCLLAANLESSLVVLSSSSCQRVLRCTHTHHPNHTHVE